MRIDLLLKGFTNRRHIPENLLIFIAIIEKKLEYVLKLISSLEDPAKNSDKENIDYKLNELKSDIRVEILKYPPEDIIKMLTFIIFLENIYKSTNEIKKHIENVEKYPPIGFDFSEIAIKISCIIKIEIDGFIAGDTDTNLETKIAETERLIKAALIHV